MKQLYLFIAVLFIVSSSYCNTNLSELDCDLVINTPISNTAYICDESVTLSVAATGSMLTYQWFFNFLPISNETANTIVATVPGLYDCVITSELCSEYVNFTVLAATIPIITSQPTSPTVCQGGPLFLSVSAIGENLTYQWFHDDLPIIGADSMYLTINTVTQADAGDYYCKVSSGCSVNSAVAHISVNYVTITSFPIDFVGCEGATFIAYIETVGTVASYELYRNNQLVEGVTGNMHSITLAEDTAGQYSWTVITPSCPPTVTSFNVFMAPSATIDAEANQSFIAGQTLADLEVAGDLIKWSATEQINFEDLLPSTTPLVDGTTYYAFAESLQSLCMSDVLAVTVHLELGINGLNKSALQYYPNPVKNTLNFKTESFINTIALYNMVGQVMMYKNIHNQSGILDMDALPQGHYILKVNTMEGEQNFKILKE
ncbi:hypothetical protein J2X31_001516 [Flavobacterium arsenatis]|uniref:Ig-like domain-containing protein n=1 Tax=Flavobacterium arsenatis TaxID=1484332 RepID=A0ABU1TNI8_9FLAO|nr:immunoglobulin domain-containing protein [Flavobacterium arsenatis]MDR6967505.1 hypothetical protein [Flavobacterium arsenatis]